MAERIAIVGAGLAGLTCARALVRAGHRVVLYEEGREPGGRIATGRVGAAAFDHGAQYFTVSDPSFAAEVEDIERGGVVARWQPRWPADTRERGAMYVGVPGMSAIGRNYATGLDVRYATRVVDVEHTTRGWRVIDEVDSITERHAVVVLAVPAPCAARIAQRFPAIVERLRSVTMSPCWAATIGWERPLDVALDADWRADPVLPWIARDRSKHRRRGPDTWVLHAAAGWSEAHLADDPGEVAQALLAALAPRLRAAAQEVPLAGPPLFATAHRWRYARVERTLGAEALWDADLRLGACGDWCIDARIEAAFLSGRALAAHIRTALQ